jgi:mannose/fructose-specific phosphotransferase system component IIA
VLKVQQLPDRSQAFAVLTDMLGRSPAQVTRLLWDTYDPSRVWTPFALAGIAAAIALFIFNHLAKRWQDVNA